MDNSRPLLGHMANQYLREMAPDGQVLVDMRPTNRAMNRSNWVRSFLTGAAIATLISLVTIRFFEWYLFTVVNGLAVTLSPIAETLRRIEGYPQHKAVVPRLGGTASP
jgi:hypothetical protein